MSNEIGTLIQALSANSAQEPRAERFARRASSAARVVAIAAFVTFVVIASGLLWWTWHTGAWSAYFWEMLPVVCGFFMLWRSSSTSPTDTRRKAAIRQSAQSLRQIAERGDEQLAPLADQQPAPLAITEPSSAMQVQLTRAHPILQGIVFGMLGFLGLMGAGCFILCAYLINLVANPFDHPQFAWWEYAVAIGIVAVVCAMGIAAIWLMVYGIMQSRREQHNRHYLVDGWGVRRGEGRSRRTIAWHDVRSFFRISPAPGWTGNLEGDRKLREWANEQKDPHTREVAANLLTRARRSVSTTYVLDAGEQIFTWNIPAHLKPADALAYERLERLIAMYSHLPLRDLSAQANELIANVAKQDTAEMSPLGAATATDLALATVQPTTRLRSTARRRWGCLVTLAPLIATVVFCGGGWGLQQYQQALYGGLPARIYAQTPLFADALSSDDDYWPVHPATQDNGAFGFVNGAYQISDGGYEALLNQYYGDAAVAVTVREWPVNLNEKMGDLGQVGLVVRETDSPAGLLTFTIGPLGDWALMRYREWGPDSGQWQFLAGGTQDHAIHWGFGANRLLIVMRGSQYICFVNDKLLAVVTDSALAVGRVGLWADASTVIGRYTNFAVYPAI